MNEENIKLIFHFQLFLIFVECSLQAAGHGLQGVGCGMRVSSRSITQQNVRETFLCCEQNKGLTDKFEVLKIKLSISHPASRKLHPAPLRPAKYPKTVSLAIIFYPHISPPPPLPLISPPVDKPIKKALRTRISPGLIGGEVRYITNIICGPFIRSQIKYFVCKLREYEYFLAFNCGVSFE